MTVTTSDLPSDNFCSDQQILPEFGDLVCQSKDKFQPLELREIGCSVIWFGVVNLDIVCGRADFHPPQPTLVSRGLLKD